MTKQDFINHCVSAYGTEPDFPFEDDFITTALRHTDTRKWYALVMQVSRRKFGQGSDEIVDVVNLKMPVEMFGSFGQADGVYPAYHMNKSHWVTAALDGTASDEMVAFLAGVSFDLTAPKLKSKRQ